MPAATVGAAYSERRHIESARQTYDSKTEQVYRETVDVLSSFSGLNLSRIEKPSKLEDKTS